MCGPRWAAQRDPTPLALTQAPGGKVGSPSAMIPTLDQGCVVGTVGQPMLPYHPAEGTGGLGSGSSNTPWPSGFLGLPPPLGPTSLAHLLQPGWVWGRHPSALTLPGGQDKAWAVVEATTSNYKERGAANLLVFVEFNFNLQ